MEKEQPRKAARRNKHYGKGRQALTTGQDICGQLWQDSAKAQESGSYGGAHHGRRESGKEKGAQTRARQRCGIKFSESKSGGVHLRIVALAVNGRTRQKTWFEPDADRDRRD